MKKENDERPVTIESCERWANVLYYQNRDVCFVREYSFEDFKQSFLLYALERWGKPLALISKSFMFSLRCCPEALPYHLGHMAHFSDLLPDGADYDSDYLERFIPCSYETFFEEFDEHTVLKKIAVYLYPKRPDLQEAFLDFLFGGSFSGKAGYSRKYNICLKIFSHRLDILKFMWQGGLLSTFDYRRYKALASELTKCPSCRKPLSMNSANVRWREWAARQRAKCGMV